MTKWEKNCIRQSRQVVTATINCPVVKITQRKRSISRAWILITTQTHETGFERRMVKSCNLVVEKIGGRITKREESVGFYRNPRCKGRETEMRDTRYEMRDPNNFFEVEGGRGYGRRKEGYDDCVDGDLKGNERGMMQAWVRIAARRQGMVSANEQGKRERKDVRTGEWCFENLCNQQWRPIVWRLGATIRSTVLSLPFRTLPVWCAVRWMPLTIMHSLLRRQIIRS